MNGFLGSYLNANSSGIAIPAGYQGYSTPTAVWDIPEPLDGLLIQCVSAGTNQALQLSLGPSGSTAPTGGIFVNDFVLLPPGQDLMAPLIFIPIPLPGDTVLFAATGANGNEADLYLNIWGIPSGILPKEMLCRYLTTTPFDWTQSGATLETSIPINSTVQMTSSPISSIIKRLNLQVSAYEPWELSIGWGPSTTMTGTLLSGLIWNDNSTTQMVYDFPCQLPPNLNLFLQNTNTTSSGNPSVLLSYFL